MEAMSSTRATRSAPCVTWRSPAARSPRSKRRSIPPEALKTVDVTGLYVTPGLDRHSHAHLHRDRRARSYAGDNSVYPDGFTFRVGVTTVADAGCAGWRNFEDFKQRIIDRVEDPRPRLPQYRRQRHARRDKYEQNLADMEAAPTAEMAKKYPGLIVGDQDRALRRARMGAGRARGRSRDDGEHPGDGGLRREQAGAAGRRAGDEEAAPGRHLHARLFGTARRAGSVGPRESRV